MSLWIDDDEQYRIMYILCHLSNTSLESHNDMSD